MSKQKLSDAEYRRKGLERARKWQADNPDKQKGFMRKYHAKKRAAKIAERKQFYLDNPAQDRRKAAR